MTFLLVMLIITGYTFIGGVSYMGIYNKVARKHFQYRYNEVPGSILLATLWPLTIPAILGAAIFGTLVDREVRESRRRERELDEARHKRDLAEIRAKEASALEKELRVLGKG